MVQHIEFIIHTKIQLFLQFFLPEVKGQGQSFKQIIVNAITWKIIINFLCEVTHEYGDDLIRFSAFHR